MQFGLHIAHSCMNCICDFRIDQLVEDHAILHAHIHRRHKVVDACMFVCCVYTILHW